MKILVATDGSECSQIAIEALPAMCGNASHGIHVQTVVEPLPTLAGLELQELESARKQVRTTVDKIKSQLPNCQIEGDVVVGQPSKVILDTAEQSGCDLIVMGTNGRKGLSRLFLGSVSRSVLLSARCGVRVVRAPIAGLADRDYNVLIATNDTFESDFAFDQILSSYWPENTKFLLVTALPDNGRSEQHQLLATSWLKCCLVRLNVKLSPRSVSYELLNGEAKAAILAKAEAWPADLIVLGSRSQGMVGRLLRGSVSEALTSSAPCSVEVLPMTKSRVEYVYVESH